MCCQRRQVFVSGLDEAAESEAICDFFEVKGGTGRVEDTYWLMDRKTGIFRGSGFMTFETVEGAITACNLPSKISESPVVSKNGKFAVVPARPMKSWKGQMHSGKTSFVSCKNLHYEITEAQLRGHFAEVAPTATVQEIQWTQDSDNNFNGGAIVTFTSSGGASEAIRNGHGSSLLGRDLTCKPATARMAAIAAHGGGGDGNSTQSTSA